MAMEIFLNIHDMNGLVAKTPKVGGVLKSVGFLFSFQIIVWGIYHHFLYTHSLISIIIMASHLKTLKIRALKPMSFPFPFQSMYGEHTTTFYLYNRKIV